MRFLEEQIEKIEQRLYCITPKGDYIPQPNLKPARKFALLIRLAKLHHELLQIRREREYNVQ